MEQVIHQTRTYGFQRAQAATDESVFHVCCWLYLVAFAILPDWFGFYAGMLFSAKRIMLLVCYVMILFSRKRLNRFWQTVKEMKVANVFILLYLFVCLYTAIYRRNFQTLYSALPDSVMVFYLFCYLLKYEIPTESLMKFLRVTLYILCVLGIFEYITQINLFAFLDTTNTFIVASHMRGGLRLQGNCHHPIQFGMYISMLFCFSCYDPKAEKLFLFRDPVLFVLSTLCVLFSGSRGPFGTYLLSVVLICLFSKRDERIISIIILSGIVAILAMVLIFAYRTYAAQWTMHMFAAIIDSIFDTTLVNDHFSQLGVNYDASSAYRDALAKVFQLDYLNPLVGRGAGYVLSVAIDGFWIMSADNNYVLTYVALAYPGMIAQLLLFGLCLFLSMKGRIRRKDMLLGAVFIASLAYMIGLWSVAAMGTMMYFWMMLAIVCVRSSQAKQTMKERKNMDISKTGRNLQHAI